MVLAVDWLVDSNPVRLIGRDVVDYSSITRLIGWLIESTGCLVDLWLIGSARPKHEATKRILRRFPDAWHIKPYVVCGHLAYYNQVIKA